MAEKEIGSDEAVNGNQKGTGRLWLIRIGMVIFAFLLGLVPMWWSKSRVSHDLAQTHRELRRSQIENHLSAASVYARRGEYETGRHNASDFFTELQTELNAPASSAFTDQERSQFPELLGSRDEIITLISRSDPAAGERISDLFVTYRAITARATPPQ